MDDKNIFAFFFLFSRSRPKARAKSDVTPERIAKYGAVTCNSTKEDGTVLSSHICTLSQAGN